MTRPSLAGIEQRAAEATEGPWGVNGPDEDWAVIHSGPDSVIHAYTVHDPDCEGCTCGGDEAGHVAISVEDAAFIAHARIDLVALAAAVRDVLAECERFRFKGRGAPDDMPTEFDEGADAAATAILRDLAARLDLTDPEGDPT